MEQLKTGDSVTIASHYAPDGKILVTNGEPISSDGILAAWGAMIRGGLRDWKFVTTDLAGDSNFLIETGTYEINGADKNWWTKEIMWLPGRCNQMENGNCIVM